MVDSCAEHLQPGIRHLLQLTSAERILYIEKDNWIGYPRAKLVLNKLQNLYLHPQRQRMPNLLIIGPSNNGKSMIIEKFCRDYPPIKKPIKRYWQKEIDERNVLVEMPILSVQMLPVPDTRRFYRSILDKLRLSDGIETSLLNAAPFEANIISVLNHYKVKMLIIDEIHNLLAGRNDKQHEFLNALRYLGNALKIPIVCVGTKDAYLAIRSDAQLENRFEPFLLTVWKAGQEYESLLASIVSVLPLKCLSNLNHPLLSNYILEKSDGILGEIFTLIRRAAIMAVNSGNEMIDEAILKKIDYHSPTERIRLFERHIAGAA
jgi:GTPase SAR1 family protein